jgi:hypothetical protein
MDPNATLEELRKLVARVHKDYEDPDGNGVDQDDADRLATLIESLDQWITKGGFLPKAWSR